MSHRSSAWIRFARLLFLLGVPGVALAQAPHHTLVVAELGAEPIEVSLSQTRRVTLPYPASRIVLADENIADFKVVSPTEFYLLGRNVGRTNLVVWRRDGSTRSVLVDVGVDVGLLRDAISRALPAEKDISITSSAASIVLDGKVSNALAADTALQLVRSTAVTLERDLKTRASQNASGGGGGGAVNQDVVNIVNLLRISDPQQVMLEVRIAEVSRSISDRLGISTNGISGSLTWKIGDIFSENKSPISGLLNSNIDIAAEQKKGLIKLLAEPTIVAISGSEASFNVGGRIFIPVPQAGAGGGGTAITLEEREFGVGLKFTPMVLENGRISLKVAPEVSELVGSASLPRFTVTRVSTTVQLQQGQSLVIGGLLRNTNASTIRRFPVLGSLPILGALFRSNDFSNDRTELVVVVRPTLVEGTNETPALPTDGVELPSTSERLLNGTIEKAAP